MDFGKALERFGNTLPRNITQKRETCGLEQSKFDPCLFVGEKVICVVYVDNLIFWSKDTVAINDSAMQLHELGVDLEQENDTAGFLGVMLERDPETSLLEMKQTADQTYHRSTRTRRWS